MKGGIFMIRKLLAMICLFVFLVTVVGCSYSEIPNKTTTIPTTLTTATPTTTAPVTVEFPLEEEVTLMLTADVPYPINSERISLQSALASNVLWQDLYERTNVNMEIQALSESDRKAELQGLLESGNYGDIILLPSLDAQSMSKHIENGRFMILDTYVNNRELMPNYNSRIFDERPEARGLNTSPDGHTYTLGGGFTELAYCLAPTCWVNKTWVEKAGMKIEDLSTLEGLETFFDWVKNNDANGNGNPTDELPYGCYPQEGITLENLLGMWGIPIASNNKQKLFLEDGEIKFVPLTENYKDFLNTMKKWFDNGWAYEDYLLGHDSIGKPLYENWMNTYVRDNGEPERIAFWTGTGAPARNNGQRMPKGTQTCEYVCILPPKVDGYETRWYQSSGFMGTKNNVAISANCENPEIALAWIDLFYSQDVSERVELGEPGSAHRWEKDGKVGYTGFSGENNWSTVGTTDSHLSQIILNWPQSISEEEWLTRRLRSSIGGASWYETERKEKQAIYKQYIDCVNKEVLPSLNMTSAATQEINAINDRIKEIVSTHQKEFLTGNANSDSDWAQFESELKTAGVDRMVALMQEAYDVFRNAME